MIYIMQKQRYLLYSKHNAPLQNLVHTLQCNSCRVTPLEAIYQMLLPLETH